MILGAHVSASGGVDKAPARGKELDINAIAIFSKNQRQWKAKPFSEEEVQRWHEEIKANDIHQAVSHDSYLINLCAPDPEKLKKSIDGLTDEVERGELLGLTHVIAHPGSHLKEGEQWGVDKIAESISEIHKRLPGYKSKITLEITAGQGTNLGYTFEQIAEMIDKSEQNDRLAVCFDTCHAYSAGYDIVEKYDEVWEEFDRIIGLDRLQVFHINDTKKPLGSRVDRHEHIGDGLLGSKPFERLVNDDRFASLPAILETPEGDDGYAKDLNLLRSLIK